MSDNIYERRDISAAETLHEDEIGEVAVIKLRDAILVSSREIIDALEETVALQKPFILTTTLAANVSFQIVTNIICPLGNLSVPPELFLERLVHIGHIPALSTGFDILRQDYQNISERLGDMAQMSMLLAIGDTDTAAAIAVDLWPTAAIHVSDAGVMTVGKKPVEELIRDEYADAEAQEEEFRDVVG